MFQDMVAKLCSGLTDEYQASINPVKFSKLYKAYTDGKEED